jgi:hypothetical protein
MNKGYIHYTKGQKLSHWLKSVCNFGIDMMYMRLRIRGEILSYKTNMVHICNFLCPESSKFSLQIIIYIYISRLAKGYYCSNKPTGMLYQRQHAPPAITSLALLHRPHSPLSCHSVPCTEIFISLL